MACHEAGRGDHTKDAADDPRGLPGHLPAGVRRDPAGGTGRHHGTAPDPRDREREPPRDLPDPHDPDGLRGRRHGPLAPERGVRAVRRGPRALQQVRRHPPHRRISVLGEHVGRVDEQGPADRPEGRPVTSYEAFTIDR